MNKQFQLTAMAAVLLGAGIGTANADVAATKGGINIKTDDGRFEANLGGRIQFDLFVLDEDDNAFADSNPASAFGSTTNGNATRSSTYFRRLYLTLSGKAYGWSYKMEPDFGGNSTAGTSTVASNGTAGRDIAFQDVYIAHAFGPGEVVIGQIKPFHGMEELTSSNELTMMERPFASAAGIFNGGSSREFQQGLFYRGEYSDFSYGAGVFDLRRDNTRATEGLGYNGRAVYAPFHADGMVLHLGVSYTDENPQRNDAVGTGGTIGTDSIGTAVSYAGRRGPSITLGSTTGGDHAETVGTELAGSFGSATMQAEYMRQSLGQKGDPKTQLVDAWYVQGSYFLTGEKKPYKKAVGVFGAPKPINDFGAIEVALRYDNGENKHNHAGCDVKYTTGSGAAAVSVTDKATKCEAEAITVGINYYVNPNVRFMLNYIHGENDRGFAKDEPNVYTARAQFGF